MDKISKEKYTLKNDVDIKFPTIEDEELLKSLKEKNTKETLIDNLNKLKENMEKLMKDLLESIKLNKNQINSICKTYKKNPIIFYVNSKLIHSIIKTILSKINSTNYDEKITSSNLFQEIDIQKLDLIFDDSIKKEINDIVEASNLKIEKIKESSNQCGIVFMSNIIKAFNNYVSKVNIKYIEFSKAKITKENNNEDNLKKNKVFLFEYILLLEKIWFGEILLYFSYFISENDIYNLEEDSEEWKQIKKVVTKVIPSNPEEIKQELDKSKEKMDFLDIFLAKAIKSESNTIFNIGRVLKLFADLKLNKKDKDSMNYETKESKMMHKMSGTKAGDLTKVKILKTILGKKYPKIEFRKKIYMKKQEEIININYIENLVKKIYYNNIEENKEKLEQKEKLPENQSQKSLPLWNYKIAENDKKYYTNARILYYNEKGIIFNEPQKYNNAPKNIKNSLGNIFNTLIKIKQPKEIKKDNINTILIYIHGGGFEKVSAFFSEGYLRAWANDLKIPIIALNYSGLPLNSYPDGLNDCFQSYMWIVNNCEKELGIKPEKIILCGVSAGSTILFGLIYLLIALNKLENKNIKLPDLVLQINPNCHIGICHTTLSMNLCFEDPMIDPGSFMFIDKNYKGNYLNDKDPFLNPSEANEILLAEFPKIRIITSSHDPLRDEAFRLLYKMIKTPNLDIKCYDFEGFNHSLILGNKILTDAPNDLIYKIIKEVTENK